MDKNNLEKQTAFISEEEKVINWQEVQVAFKKSFGNETVSHIEKMTSFNLKRKHHDQEVDY